MRSTLTLDVDVSRLLQDRMKQEDKPYKQIVNEAIRNGFQANESRPVAFTPLSFSLGEPKIDLTKANALAAEFEDQEIKAKLIENSKQPNKRTKK